MNLEEIKKLINQDYPMEPDETRESINWLIAEVERLEDENHALSCARDHLLRVLEKERKGGTALKCIELIQNICLTRSAVVMKIKKEFVL